LQKKAALIISLIFFYAEGSDGKVCKRLQWGSRRVALCTNYPTRLTIRDEARVGYLSELDTTLPIG
jgi:hypothetical protein